MYKRIVIIILIICISIYIFFIQKNNINEDISSKKIESNIIYFKNNKTKFDYLLKNRFVKLQDDGISIGKSKNELDNGYYDVYIKVSDNSIQLYINKLFKDFNKNEIYDKQYIDEIIEYISKAFNFIIDKTTFSNLIIDNYEKIRDIDRNNVEDVDKTVIINNISVNVTVQNNMLVIKMGDI